MNPIVKYLQDTRAELRHVAWPTREQTIIYTILVVALSVGVSLYLGFFDFLFTSSLSRALTSISNYQQPVQQQEEQAPAAAATTSAPASSSTQPATPKAFTIPTN